MTPGGVGFSQTLDALAIFFLDGLYEFIREAFKALVPQHLSLL